MERVKCTSSFWPATREEDNPVLVGNWQKLDGQIVTPNIESEVSLPTLNVDLVYKATLNFKFGR